jgi:hypothetical protein
MSKRFSFFNGNGNDNHHSGTGFFIYKGTISVVQRGEFASDRKLYIVLTRGPGRLKPSNSAPVLQYGSRPSYDFLAKIFVVDTPLFLFNI